MALLQSSYVLPLERFTFDNNTLTAFESDLRNHPFDGTFPWLNRIWDDACDAGIVIRSHYTGKDERFYLEREETREGDILAWYFRPLKDSCRVKKVIIFND